MRGIVVEKKKKKKNTVRTDEPTPGTLALIGDSRASALKHSDELCEYTS